MSNKDDTVRSSLDQEQMRRRARALAEEEFRVPVRRALLKRLEATLHGQLRERALTEEVTAARHRFIEVAQKGGSLEQAVAATEGGDVRGTEVVTARGLASIMQRLELRFGQVRGLIMRRFPPQARSLPAYATRSWGETTQDRGGEQIGEEERTYLEELRAALAAAGREDLLS